jgi:two-component system, response regulator PdtaR
MHIVAADTNPDVHRFYADTLLPLGYKVCTVSSGRQLVHQCKLLQPDLIISEVNLPDMDAFHAGGDICKERRVPIIIVSAHCETELLSSHDEDCILAILSKPVCTKELAIAIRWACEQFQLYPVNSEPSCSITACFTPAAPTRDPAGYHIAC